MWPVYIVLALLIGYGMWQRLGTTEQEIRTTNTLQGSVTHVRDGDTIEVAGTPIRLNGVAAPELNEPRGQEAKKFMSRLVSRKSVRCDLNGDRSYDRVIGTCYLDGQDIGKTIISAGLARDCVLPPYT